VAPTQEVIRRASQIEEQLLEFQAKVEAYLIECQGAIAQVREPLEDLELVRATNELASQIVVAEKEAWCTVDEVVDTLGHMTGTLRKEIEERFGESGVLVASEVEIVTPLRYLEVVESTVATFDPAKIRQRVAAM
jgi:Fe-S oxidoreductase